MAEGASSTSSDEASGSARGNPVPDRVRPVVARSAVDAEGRRSIGAATALERHPVTAEEARETLVRAKR